MMMGGGIKITPSSFSQSPARFLWGGHVKRGFWQWDFLGRWFLVHSLS